MKNALSTVGMSQRRWSQRLIGFTTAPFIAFAAVTWSNITRADVVTDWNAIAVDTILAAVPPRPLTVGVLDIAIVQAAVYDAVEAIDRRFKPYYVQVRGGSGSPIAATARAAHDVLVDIFPGQASSLDATYSSYLANNGLAADDPGVAVGQTAAARMLALRANDGRMPNPLPPPFLGGTEIGVWRPTPPTGTPMVTPWLGAVPPFTLKSGDQFRPGPPPPLTSTRYTTDYEEVKALGARHNSARTPEQTELAYFYTTNLFALWYRTLRDVANTYVSNMGASARLLALASLANADSIIAAWDSKTYFIFWRPITAIQLGDFDGNPETVGDVSWEPLLSTPSYPEYTSGVNANVGALTRTLALFFGTDEMTFTVRSDNPFAPQTRTYKRFSDMAKDMVDVRIYQGVHFRSADEEGRKQGRHVAQWVFGHYLRPLDDSE
jgi:hypothetical protein